jgi:hypothetical protein
MLPLLATQIGLTPALEDGSRSPRELRYAPAARPVLTWR